VSREKAGNTVGLLFNVALGLIFGVLYLNKVSSIESGSILVMPPQTFRILSPAKG
jgi:hypothetical protein